MRISVGNGPVARWLQSSRYGWSGSGQRLDSSLIRDEPSAASKQTAHAGEEPEFSTSYLVAMLTSIVGLVALFGIGLVALNRVGLLPPPQLTNNLCLDSKLEYLRYHHFDEPTVLAVGSSVTWRSLDGDAITRASQGRAVTLNGAFCGLKMNQTAFTAAYFLARYPSVRDVVTIVAPEDMTACSETRTAVFDAGDVDDYINHRRWVFPLYLEYFDPITLAKNVAIIRAMRNGELPLDNLVFDRYGSAPLDTTLSADGLVYGPLQNFDDSCFAALRSLARTLAAAHRRLVVATMPLNPEWKRRYDPDGRILREMTNRIRDSIAGTPTVFWDANRSIDMKPSAFTDAIHIRWSAAKAFSRELVRATGLGQAM